ncbi:Speckle-type POZ protein [Folsomia candida]|uniref:Speckle-type POZ protein n=1 Tax=Folsomia candida TaxID=158441 RepID=A0A226D6B6_FOLCA|nr:Speckle-type POZ protein [Folsomia candida]
MFRHDMKEAKERKIIVDDISAPVLKEYLLFLYCQKVEKAEDGHTLIEELFKVPEKYDVPSLKNTCEQNLVENVGMKNAAKLHCLADMYNGDVLKEQALRVMINGHNATDDIMTEIKPADCTPPRCQTLVGFDAPPINMITYPHNTELPRRQPIANFAEKSCKICAAAIFIGLEHCIMNLKRSEDRGIIKNRKTALPASSHAPRANTVTHTSTQTSRKCLSHQRDCSFYSRCLEKSIPCGENGYATGWGDKYCTKFVRNVSKFSPMGQTWMWSAMSCLQRALEPIANGEVSMNCSQITEFAYTSHPDCYIVSTPGGVCLLPFTDWVELVGSIEINVLVVKQMVITAIFCGKVYYGKIMATMKTVYASLNSKLI